jgi:(2Fe-2S) ferredoxin
VATDPNVLRDVLHHWGVEGEDASANNPQAATDEENADAEDALRDSDDESVVEDVREFVPGRTLAENSQFATMVRHCRRPQDPPPHLLFYADPLGMVRNFGRDSGGVQFAMGMFPAIGLDGLQAIGGSFTAATDEYDDLSHFHVLLANPRSGVMQLPAFEQGDTAPQPFVPLAAESYLAWHWNMRVFYDRVATIVDQFQGEGATDKNIEENVSAELGINVQTDVIDNLGTRYTWVVGYEKPARFRGQQHVLAIELKDEALGAKTLETVIKKYPEVFEERSFGQTTYHAMLGEGLKELAEEDRPMEPCVAIMDGHLFIGTSCQLFERCVAARDGTVDRLVDSEDYARTAAVLGRETAGTTPVLFSVSRYEESIRHWYELLTSEKTREMIDEHKEDNPVLTALAEALDQHKLPPFEALAPYLPPGGMILYDTDDGYHGIGFTLRNEAGQ